MTQLAPCAILDTVTVTHLLDRPVYTYQDADRLVGLHPGTARRWINGYKRNGRNYAPILRESSTDSDWVTWGEFVETRILSEYRDDDIPTRRLRGAVQALRATFRLKYPLAHLRPYLAAESGDLALTITDAEDAPWIPRTGQLLLSSRSRDVLTQATLGQDDNGEKFAIELVAGHEYPGIVMNPARVGGQPTFLGTRIPVATIAGMVSAGDSAADLAAAYGLSLSQVDTAVRYARDHHLRAA